MASLLPDQAAVWNKKHASGDHLAHRDGPMPFGKRAMVEFPTHATILEIGCGIGADSAYFAKQGYSVTATDLSQVVIAQNKAFYKDLGIEFRELDVSQPLPFSTGQFAVVYSHLALHYFPHATTVAVFAELHRVLQPGGILAFACKSTNDPLYGDGQEIEPNLFVRKDHVRHFFSSNYAKELLGDAYDIIQLEEVQEDITNRISSMIHCIARKKPT